MWGKVSFIFILPFRYSSSVLDYTCCWQCVSCLKPNQYQHPVLTRSLSFQGGNGTIILQGLNVQIHEEPHIRSKNAPSVHRLCWMALVNRPSNDQLCDLGNAMTPLVFTGLPQNIYQNHLTLSKAVHKLQNFKNDNKKTTLYELL